MQTQGLVTLVPWTLIAQIANLLIQMYLIKRFLFKPIKRILAQRQEKTDAEIRAAEAAKAEAEEIKASYEKNIQEARDKAGAIVESAQKTADATSEKILTEANRQAVAIKEKAEREIEQEKKRAVREIREDIGGLAVDLAGKVIERELNEEDHRKLIDDYIQNVGEAS